MLSIKLIHVIFGFLALELSNTQRRIKDGQPVQDSENKTYVVYLIKATSSPQAYDSWLCGGAIVHPSFILTSAACVEDVKHMYAVAGYKKYISADRINADACTRDKKKKIVFTCVPKAYELDYSKTEKWSYIDIAVIKVESPYDFNDKSYETSCSYTPSMITINYETKYQEVGTDALVLGWGHLEQWRQPGDQKDYNQEVLNYGATLIHDKQDCKKYFENQTTMYDVIDKYMICTFNPGNINAAGNLIVKSKPAADGCGTGKLKGDGSCEDDIILLDEEETRRNPSKSSQRRTGICQNDHGGPLITWVGGHDVLIGVASVFRVDADSHCTGPYLFTSTQCNGLFLSCILNSTDGSGRRMTMCDKQPAEMGFHLVEREISWLHHPAGPADNEVIETRPQVPLNYWGV